MAENTIFVNKYRYELTKFPIDEKEIWRYAGYFGDIPSITDELKNELSAVIRELENAFSFLVCYRRMEIEWENDMPVLPFASESKKLAACLKGSSEVVLFAATIGLEIDRKIARYQRISPLKALLMQAFGAERVECLCEVFCDEIKQEAAQEGLSVTTRFSPGYGDLPLEKQRDFFRLLDCNRQVGISLNESLLMSPSKSVTAIFGIGECVDRSRKHDCKNCSKTDCEYRKE